MTGKLVLTGTPEELKSIRGQKVRQAKAFRYCDCMYYSAVLSVPHPLFLFQPFFLDSGHCHSAVFFCVLISSWSIVVRISSVRHDCLGQILGVDVR